MIDFIPLSFSANPTLTDSKLLGKPVGGSFDGEDEYRMFAQINFQQLHEALAGKASELNFWQHWPSSGFLQLFFKVSDSSVMHGLDFDNPSNGFLVRFIPATHANESKRRESQFMGESDTWMPLLSSMKINFGKMAYQNIQGGDEQYGALGDNEDNENQSGPFHQVGGSPFFTQSDPRVSQLDPKDPWILLLQIDSDDSIGCMWGDMGVGNLFIRLSDLKAGNFSQCLWNWDCC